MADAEKSRLLNKQKAEIVALQKDIKKKKGALKEEAQKKLDEAEERHERELKELESGASSEPAKGKGKGGKDKDSKKKKKDESDDEEPAEEKKDSKKGKEAKKKTFPVLDWSGLSKTELEDEAAKRGLSKKGNKEQLVTRLHLWAQEQEVEKKMAKATLDEKDAASSSKKGAKGGKPWPMHSKPAEPESDEDESDESDESDDDEETPVKMTEEELAEAERQYKREMMFRKALRAVLKKNEEGVAVKDMISALEDIGVKNFAVDKVGYKSMEALLAAQPENLCFYDDVKGMVFPPDDE